MNSKSLVLVLFAVWSAICWRWYVCVIKEACETKEEIRSVVLAPADDTTPASPVTTPPAATQSQTGQAKTIQPSGNKTVDESAIDKVQLVGVEGRMVIYFPYSSTRREDNQAIDEYLSRLAEQLAASGGTVTITGHTDFVGESKTNYEYGLKRATGIRDILVKKGVKKTQVKCKSFGETKPVATNDTALGRYKNRRAEIVVSQ